MKTYVGKGKKIVATLSRQLETEYGKGWSEKQLRHCLRFAETIADEQIVATLWQQLTTEYGEACSEKNLRRMMQFGSAFPEKEIVVCKGIRRCIRY